MLKLSALIPHGHLLLLLLLLLLQYVLRVVATVIANIRCRLFEQVLKFE